MRTVWIAVLGLLGVCPLAQAGVYNLHRADPPRPAHLIPAHLFALRGAVNEPKDGKLDPDSIRGMCMAEVEHFEPKLADGTLETTEAITLSSAYIRMGETAKAIRVLEQADREHFLVQANLAGAYQAVGELELAHRHQQTALDLWPRTWVGWHPNVLEGYREYERYNLRLMTLRLEESRRGTKGEVGVDALFPDVRFVGESGKYEAGQISRRMRDRLPKNAGDIVLQLTLWQPQDHRLCYLLAELFNAYGNVAPAFQLIDSIVKDRRAYEGILQHRQVLRSGKAVLDELEKRENRYGLMSELLMIPRPTLGVPGIGDMANYYSALYAPAVVAPHQDKMAGQPPPNPPQPAGTPAGPAPLLPFNLTHVGVSFVFGVLVAAALGMQWQQWKKNRPAVIEDVARSPAPTGGEEKSSEFVRQAPP